MKKGALYTWELAAMIGDDGFADSGDRGAGAAATDGGKWIVWNSSFVSFSKSSKKKLSLLEIIEADADIDALAVNSGMFWRLYKNLMQCVAATQLAVIKIVTHMPK